MTTNKINKIDENRVQQRESETSHQPICVDSNCAKDLANSAVEFEPLEPLHIVGDGAKMRVLSREEANAPLGVPVVVVGEEHEYYATYSVNEAAHLLEVCEKEIIEWVESGKLVGIDFDVSGLRVPKAQVRNGQIAPFLENFRHHFTNSKYVWQYLVSEQYVAGEWIRPLDVHFEDDFGFAMDLAYSQGTEFQ